MSESVIPLLIISGPVGVGKSSVAGELSALLERKSIPHTLIDLDGLSYTYPRPENDRFASRLACDNLAAIWPNCVAAGAKNIIIARTVEAAGDVEMIAKAVPGTQQVVCQLYASDNTLTARVKNREKGSGLDWHIARAKELSASLAQTGPADIRIDTDARPLDEIAKDIFDQIDWRK